MLLPLTQALLILLLHPLILFLGSLLLSHLLQILKLAGSFGARFARRASLTMLISDVTGKPSMSPGIKPCFSTDFKIATDMVVEDYYANFLGQFLQCFPCEILF